MSFVEFNRSMPTGEHQVRVVFAYAGGGLGNGGTASLNIDGKNARRVAMGRQLG